MVSAWAVGNKLSLGQVVVDGKPNEITAIPELLRLLEAPQQVLEHQVFTARRYALTDRAVALGWSGPRVQVIDDDLGKSGQSIEGRPGFRRLPAEVAPDRVGLILGLEMSRLARSCKDWHHLTDDWR